MHGGLLKQAPTRQRGVILIMALLIVVLVTSVVVAVSWRFTLDMARNENRWHGSQARAYMEGGEQLARKILWDDLAETGNVDHLGEMWAQAGDPLPTDEGWIRGTIEDAHGRLNLNLLIPPVQQGNPNNNDRNQDPWEKLSESQRCFVRLLQTIELESGPVQYQQAMELIDAIKDWLDPDEQVSGFGGAEADYYRDLDPPYPITNGPMTSVSELSLIKGMTPELYEKLLPLVIALPPGEKMNINTLKEPLLRCLNRKMETLPLTEADWEAIKADRAGAAEGFREINDFLNAPNVSAILGGQGEFDSADFGTSARYFLFSSETLVGEQVRRGKTLLFRGDLNGVNHVHIVRRTDANF